MSHESWTRQLVRLLATIKSVTCRITCSSLKSCTRQSRSSICSTLHKAQTQASIQCLPPLWKRMVRPTRATFTPPIRCKERILSSMVTKREQAPNTQTWPRKCLLATKVRRVVATKRSSAARVTCQASFLQASRAGRAKEAMPCRRAWCTPLWRPLALITCTRTLGRDQARVRSKELTILVN